tara:strand:- start:239 stop:649 length:411 start_codon:yes stop_codon:yes gene_type:complete
MPNYNKVYDRTRKQYLWWIERDSIGIAEYDPMVEEKNKFTSPDAAYQITLFYYKKADHFNTLDSGSSAMTEQSELPTQFHQYLVDKAIQYGYEEEPDMLNKALYFERRFERGIKEGKTFANRGRISGIGSIKQHSY